MSSRSYDKREILCTYLEGSKSNMYILVKQLMSLTRHISSQDITAMRFSHLFKITRDDFALMFRRATRGIRQLEG